MSLESLECPNCGAPLTDTGGRSVVVCAHCGSSIRIHNPESPTTPIPPREPERREAGTPSATVGEYGRSASSRPARSPLASVTLGPEDVREVVQLLRDKQQVTAIQYYQSKVGGTLGDAKEAIEAIEAGLADASAPLPSASAGYSPSPPTAFEVQALNEARALLRRGNREMAIRRYRVLTGADLNQATTVIDGLERQTGRVARASLRPARRRGGCAAIFGLIVVIFICVTAGCGVYLQTKPIYRCSIDQVKSEVTRLKLLRAPVRAGLLVISPSFQESSTSRAWHLTADYFTPVWGANGFDLAYVSVAASSTGTNLMEAKLYTNKGTVQLQKWGPVDCPASDE